MFRGVVCTDGDERALEHVDACLVNGACTTRVPAIVRERSSNQRLAISHPRRVRPPQGASA